jgi:hypothetical protein
MNVERKNKIIDIITFITHFIISISFVLLGWFAISWANSYRTEEDLTIYYFIIIAGIILFFINFYILFTSSFRAYLITLATTLVSAIIWAKTEGSIDVYFLLPFYVIIFAYLAFYKYKLNNNKIYTS